MRKIYVVFFVFYSIVFYSQKQWSEKQIDSIQNTIATTNAQNVDKIEAVCTELYYQSKQINYKKGQIEALLRKIAFKINSRNYDDVEQYLDETKKLSNDIQDYFYLTKANAMEVSMLSHLQLHTKAKKKLDENFKLIPKIEDIGKRRFMETYYYARYINLYQNNKDSLQYFSNQRLKTALLLPDTEASKPIIIVSSAGYLAHYYFHAKNPKQIDYYLKVQEKYIDKIDNLFDLIHYHKRKAEYIFDYQKKSKDYLDRSLYHFKKAEKYAQQYKNPELLELLYPEIARIYEDKNEIDKQVYYLNKYTKLTDSIKKKNTTAVANIVYQDKQKSYNSEKKVYDWKMRKYVFLAGLFILLTFFLVKMFFLKKNKKFVEINSQQQYPLESKEEIKISKEQLLNLTAESNVAFLSFFLELHPDFRDSLLNINPNLTLSDIEFCALIKSNLNNHQISVFKKMSIRAIDSKKYRLRKKLNISSNESIYDWMANI